MDIFNSAVLKKLYIPPKKSHKGQNGKVLLVGGSKLFHSASIWALSIASKIVDMVFYASVPENNEIVQKAKEEFRNGIIIPRSEIEHYAREADCILIGPGMERISNLKSQISNQKLKSQSFKNIDALESWEQTYWLTKILLEKFPKKKFVLDAGSLQMMDPKWLLKLEQMPILTPHMGEFEILLRGKNDNNKEIYPIPYTLYPKIKEMAKKYHCVILLKGQEDIVCYPHEPRTVLVQGQDGAGQAPGECVIIKGGNAGMTKGGTGDVLAGLAASLYAQNNDAFLVAQAASFFNKKAGESLFKNAGYYFNATDLVEEIPKVMKEYLITGK